MIHVLGTDRFATALRTAIGSVSQFTDSVTLFDDGKLYEKLQKLYQ